MEVFRTPTSMVDRSNRFKLNDMSQSQTPVIIPESPFMTRLGCGTGVSVYSLSRRSGLNTNIIRSPWAIKKLNRGVTEKEFEERITIEAGILKNMNHPNIVGFRALVESADGRKCLAMEECRISLGDLIEERNDEGFGPFPVSDIIKVALDVASALDYLHTTCRILHGDIKSANILIKDEFNAVKLCDFGVSLPLDEFGTLLDKADDDESDCNEYVGTPCWSAPEVLIGADGPTTNKADVFAYGLVLWEMMSLKPPHIFEDGEDSDASFDEEVFNKRLGTRPAIPSVADEYKPIIDLFVACTEQDLNKRPDAKTIIKMIQDIKT